MGLEGLLTELFVSTVLDGIHLETVRVGVDVMVLGEQVADGIESEGNEEDHGEHNLGVRNLRFTEVGDIFSDIMGHLRSGRRSSIIVLNHTIVKLRRHSNNHMIEVGVEVSALRDIETERSVVVVTSQQVVRIGAETWGHSGYLGKIWRPNTLVGILSLMDSHVWWPDSVINDTLSVVPFLEVVTSVLLMSRVDLRKVNHLIHELSLGETLVDDKIVLLMHSTVATLACSGENLEASAESGRVESVPGDIGWEVVVTVVHTDRVNLLFVTLDTVRGTNVISENPGFSRLCTVHDGVESTAGEE